MPLYVDYLYLEVTKVSFLVLFSVTEVFLQDLLLHVFFLFVCFLIQYFPGASNLAELVCIKLILRLNFLILYSKIPSFLLLWPISVTAYL